ncbi:MAG: hypothetical protein JWR51_4362 [Devosia sp.]|uniref:YqiJ family protein n=1 Tax=Devosia sp. TaxID=1871048 RepID=UPI00261D01A1|nr:YqiJ family protein [Devosia sp.]MDB5531259.1 hypothetical protein [Devosia sp.]
MDVFAAATAPFAVAIGLTLAIALIEMLGLLIGIHPSSAIDSALPDLHVDVDVPHVDIGHLELNPLSQTLTWLSFGRVPALVVLILLAASFGLIGFVLQEFLRQSFGFTLDPWLASIPAAIGAVFATRHGGRLLGRIMPKEESDAVSTAAFVGRIATVFRGQASAGRPAEAKLSDIHGKTHYLLVEPEEAEQVFSEGSEVVIIRQEGSVYRAITRLKPAA